ncbi:hypothetical protein J0S82_009056 [Galemys pyrenaicus]|uniref:Uncharacterized protein n=1 Tax=Galemys pyrenaicus TaxID=202257 RepID=A0A8J6AL70_GALPY|nr:hypothetical protein J0S82_009056 [Galemys pyrenaicus]
MAVEKLRNQLLKRRNLKPKKLTFMARNCQMFLICYEFQEGLIEGSSPQLISGLQRKRKWLLLSSQNKLAMIRTGIQEWENFANPDMLLLKMSLKISRAIHREQSHRIPLCRRHQKFPISTSTKIDVIVESEVSNTEKEKQITEEEHKVDQKVVYWQILPKCKIIPNV